MICRIAQRGWSRCLVLALSVYGCDGCPRPAPRSDAAAVDGGDATTVVITNLTGSPAVVNVSVGSDSAVLPSAWYGCPDAGLTCSFTLPELAAVVLPTAGQYLNASVAFNGPVGCGSTIAEFTANSPNGYGTADVSLVNGYNAAVRITVDGQTLVPAADGGNAKALGVFPYGCDICVARQGPPCGIDAGGCTAPGSCGCKSGAQYNPTVPCQVTYQRADAGSNLNVALLP